MSDSEYKISTGGTAKPADRAQFGGKAPMWLLEVLTLISGQADKIEPIKDDRSQLPEFIYRH